MNVDGTALPPCKVHPLARPFASQSGRFLEDVSVKRKKAVKQSFKTVLRLIFKRNTRWDFVSLQRLFCEWAEGACFVSEAGRKGRLG